MRTLPQRGPIPLIRAVITRAGDRDAGTLAAALTYQALLSIVPVVLLAGAVVGFVFADDPERAARWVREITATIPGLEEILGTNVQALIDARVQAGLIALAVLAWTGSSLAGRAAHALAKMFGLVERPWYGKRLWALLELVVLGVAVLAGIGLTALTATGAGPLPFVAAATLDLVLALLLYVVLTPRGGPSWRGHLPGAIAFTVAWVLLKTFGAWYVDVVVTRASAIYGTIAAVFGLLAILSIASSAFVHGAALSAVWAERGHGSNHPSRAPSEISA